MTFLTPVLFNFFLDELDEAHFPYFRYARHYHEIFVPIFLGEFSVPRFRGLLEELGLFVNVIGIVPGGVPIDCFIVPASPAYQCNSFDRKEQTVATLLQLNIPHPSFIRKASLF